MDCQRKLRRTIDALIEMLSCLKCQHVEFPGFNNTPVVLVRRDQMEEITRRVLEILELRKQL